MTFYFNFYFILFYRQVTFFVLVDYNKPTQYIIKVKYWY